MPKFNTGTGWTVAVVFVGLVAAYNYIPQVREALGG